MRLLLFFDLPRNNTKECRQATRFVSDLKKEGFMMLQESVYSKLLLTPSYKPLIINKLKKIKPSSGNIFVLTITEKQFADMDYLLGTKPTTQVDSTDRLIII